ncbi:MAG TPA: S1 RNA-binding domain-containing protein, partial [Spirochaetota bacterium]|nr:S1 RNA-binding domain-containing protein [Spirochaetota bacterium]
MTEDNYDTIDMASVADSALEDIQPGMIVKGEIVTVDSGYAYVNVGTKSDGRVPLEEFDTVPKVGEVYEVKLMNRKLVDGVYQFSRKAAVAEKSWKDFIESYNKGNREVKGKIKSSNDKGKILSLSGVNAFLPASLAADLKSVSSSDEEYFFVVKDVDKKKKSVLVSRKDYIEELNKKKWEDFLSKYKEGDIVKGEVVKFVEFGAFVRIDGIDALLHRNDMSWKKVFKQRKILKLGEVRDFVILSINRDELKVSLGLKQLKEDPWLAIAQKFNPGDIVKGKVVTITPVGAFVQIDEDIEGFVANSELSWTKSNANVKDYFSKGDESDFVILSIEPQDKKIALGFKQLSQNPWETIDERFPIDSIWKRPIKKIVKFGLFVEL